MCLSVKMSKQTLFLALRAVLMVQFCGIIFQGTAVVLYKRKISSKQIDSNYSPCLYSLLYRGICINRSLQYAQPHPRSSGL
ncbi:hypothetical protein AAC387_Pa07g2502 [Persea americana]